MKKIFTILTVLFIGNVVLANAQELKYIKDAAIVNEDGSLTLIPTQEANYNMALVMTAKGAAASTRIPACDSITIKMKVRSVDENPEDKVRIYKLNKGKKSRSVMLSMVRNKKAEVEFHGETEGECYYLLTIPAQEVGEYCIWYIDGEEGNKLGKHMMSFYGIDAE